MAKKKPKKAKRTAAARTLKPAKTAGSSKHGQSAAMSRKKAKSAARTSSKPARRTAASTAPAALPASAPTPPAGAELIVRQGFVIDATAKRHAVIPEVLVLGNRDGLRYLADLFAYLADQAARGKSDDPFAALQIGRNEHPVNTRLSDGIEFRFSFVNEANRAATFKRHGVTMKSREQGSLFGRYQDVASTQYQNLARRIGAPPVAKPDHGAEDPNMDR
jgi:hypothetical protein